MFFQKTKLLAIMLENGVTRKMMAEWLGISVNTLNTRCFQKGIFTNREIATICKYLPVRDPLWVFVGIATLNKEKQQ